MSVNKDAQYCTVSVVYRPHQLCTDLISCVQTSSVVYRPHQLCTDLISCVQTFIGGRIHQTSLATIELSKLWNSILRMTDNFPL